MNVAVSYTRPVNTAVAVGVPRAAVRSNVLPNCCYREFRTEATLLPYRMPDYLKVPIVMRSVQRNAVFAVGRRLSRPRVTDRLRSILAEAGFGVFRRSQPPSTNVAVVPYFV